MKRLMPGRFVALLRGDPTAPLELPSDAVRDGRHRVRVAATMGVVAYGVFLAFALGGARGGTELERTIDRWHDLIGLGLCASLWIVSAWPSLPDRFVLVAALVAEVMLCALISVGVSWAGFVRTGHLPGLTWIVPVIILFALLVPIAPRTALIVSSLCVLTAPIGMWLLASRGAIVAHGVDYGASLLTGLVGVGIASVASRTVYGARRQAAVARTIGSYELLEPLGQGGMGEVWKARHLLLARPAAVKLILPERLQGPQEARDAVTERFAREARVTASLRSPHTVALFDFGADADGTLYYAMELLEGVNAEHFVYRFGPLEPRRVVSWLQQACHSLGEAHSHNLVHRDIKPANLFVCRYGRDRDFVKLLDFGLTKPMERGAGPTLTSAGARLGTPGYMPPEQVFGLPSEPRSDLYALGCVGYWLLAGEKPFESDSAAELMRHHAQTPPPPLSLKTGRAVPERLESVIMGCLSKDPNDRPADADRLCAALAESLDGAPWTEADARDWWERNLSEL